jgi:type I restriction enzyme S subunit
MRSNYKKIGDYIRTVNNRNTNLKVNKLVGLSMTKEFRETTSNIVGTDMSVYKIINKWQFACDFMSVIRVHKFPVVLKTDDEPVLVSPAYPVFEVKDINELHPEYLMMWFRRSEFDRYADFKCDSAIRGGYDWDALCDTEIPIPSIEKQRAMVKEYNVIKDRIELNNKLSQKLEETAQAIYKQWFVDFEFPDENGKPYKSSGGEMEYCEELEKDVPKGWEVRSINSLCEITSSKRVFESEYREEGILFCRGKEITLKKNGQAINEPIYISKDQYTELTEKHGKLKNGDILMTAVGTIGSTYMVQEDEFYFKDGNVIWFRDFHTKNINYYLYDFMQSEQFFSIIDEITIGSTQNAITIQTFGLQKIVIPSNKVLELYIKLSKKIINNLNLIKKESYSLSGAKNILLSRLAAVND